MISPGRIAWLLCMLLPAQMAAAQTDSPKRLVDLLPRDKTSEQLLALLVIKLGAEEFKSGAYDRAVPYFSES
jgi:hypothetical protein